METFTFTIQEKNGLHARPAGLLVREAQKFSSNITIACGDRKCDAKKLFALLGMNIREGETVQVTVEGPDSSAAVSSLQAFFKEQL